jgi:hypothetical protein
MPQLQLVFRNSSAMSALLLVAASACVFATADTAHAGDRRDGMRGGYFGYYGNYRSGPQVRGFIARRGGYSYVYPDAINTYGDSRSRFGSASSLRDPGIDRQTNAGPFDHGFFFDSGVAPRGGSSPYMN